MKPRFSVFVVVMAIMVASGYANNDLTGYLEKYGYLAKNEGSERGEAHRPEDMSAAIKNFQRFAGLTVTGIQDEETIDKMQQSRCGVPDDVGNVETSPGMPVALKQMRPSEKWPKTALTWSVKKYSETSSMSKKRQLYAIRKGFRRWAEVTHLTFQEVIGKADIELSFGKFEHGDKDAFDGRGNTLAHAFPPVDGRTHFDDSEDWTEGVDRGTNLEHVATHEIGHALGLWHLPGTYPVMSPYYPGYIKDFKLHRYDIHEIQRRYGKRETNESMDLAQFCGQEYASIKAALRVDKIGDYIFVDRNMVISGVNGRKTHVKRLFIRGPSSVDAAAFSVLTNTAYLFKGRKVWAFTQTPSGRFSCKNGFPKYLHHPGLKNPEAAVRVQDKDDMETILLIKGGLVWVWMPYHEKLAPGIPLPAKEIFPRIPKRMDAAISGDNIVNFIVGKKFYANNPKNRLTTKRSIPMRNLFKCRKG